MAQSKYEYVKKFETNDTLLPNTWIVIRIDGRGFHRFSQTHEFRKPNDDRALRLMNAAASAVMKEYTDIILGYGQSDEYSFVIKKSSNLYQRRASKLVSVLTSLFAVQYVYQWPDYFETSSTLKYPPCFDGRAVIYPSDRNLRDYLSWRQVDCHINNLYNTTFWALVHSGKSEQESEALLCGSLSKNKNEILFSEFGINYNELPEMFRKGSVLTRQKVERQEVSASGQKVTRSRPDVVVEHCDIIQDEFWKSHSWLMKDTD